MVVIITWTCTAFYKVLLYTLSGKALLFLLPLPSLSFSFPKHQNVCQTFCLYPSSVHIIIPILSFCGSLQITFFFSKFLINNFIFSFVYLKQNVIGKDWSSIQKEVWNIYSMSLSSLLLGPPRGLSGKITHLSIQEMQEI